MAAPPGVTKVAAGTASLAIQFLVWLTALKNRRSSSSRMMAIKVLAPSRRPSTPREDLTGMAFCL